MEGASFTTSVIARTEQLQTVERQLATRTRALLNEFTHRFGDLPKAQLSLVCSPGRAEIIGNHTDYGGGETLSANISKNLLLLGKKRDDHQIRIYSQNIGGDNVAFQIDDLRQHPDTWKANPAIKDSWSNYIKSVVRVFLDQDIPVCGFDAVLESSIPVGAGLSSSAAIELAVAETIRGMTGNTKLSNVDLARICKQAENQYVGMPCGFLDQVTEAMAGMNQILHITHRPDTTGPFSTESVSAALKEAGFTFIIGYDPNHERALVSGEFQKRQKAIVASLPILQHYVPTLQHVGQLTLEQYHSLPSDQLQQELRQKYIPPEWLSHVVHENDRVKKSIAALQKQDYLTFGALLSASGDSAIYSYQLDDEEKRLSFVQKIFKQSSALGARNMGGGFSPTTIALVPINHREEIQKMVQQAYAKQFGGSYTFIEFTPSPTVGSLDVAHALTPKRISRS